MNPNLKPAIEDEPSTCKHESTVSAIIEEELQRRITMVNRKNNCFARIAAMMNCLAMMSAICENCGDDE